MSRSLQFFLPLIFLLPYPLFAQEPLWVDFATATFSTFSPSLQVSGNFSSTWSANLSGILGGVLQDVPVAPGTRLASGEKAFSFDNRDYALALQMAKASLDLAEKRHQELKSGVRKEEKDRLRALRNRSEVMLSQLEREKWRLKKLFDERVISESQWEDIQSKRDAAENQVIAADAALNASRIGATPEQLAVSKAMITQATISVRQAEKRLSDCTIFAPCDCAVLRVLKNHGETVPPQVPVLQVHSLDPLKIRFFLSESQAGKLTIGQKISWRNRSQEFSGVATLSAIVPICDETTGKIPCEAILTNSDGKLFPGQAVDLDIPLLPVQGTLVPMSSIIDGKNGKSVFAIEGNKVREIPIGEIAVSGNMALVEGLQANIHVVSRGARGLRDGAEVQVKR